MATVSIAHLGNGSGKVYEVNSGGTIINHWKNTAAIRKLLKLRVLESQINHVQNAVELGTFTENHHDPDGYRYYLDSNSGATGLVMSGDTIEITKYLIEPGKVPTLTKTIASGVLTVERFGPITNVIVVPEAGTDDELDAIKGPNFTTKELDFQPGDLVILWVTDTTYNIRCMHNTSGNGHLRMAGLMDYLIKGSTLTPHAAFIKRNESGAERGWEEVFRSGTFMQTKKIQISGGAQNINPNTDATYKIANQEGVIFLEPTGVTQTGAFVLDTSDALPGQKYSVLPIGVWTDVTTGTITIFGKSITTNLAKKGGWRVDAYYDENFPGWRAQLIGTNPITYEYRAALAAEANYQNDSLIGLAVGDFVYLVGGVAMNFSGSRANATFNSGSGTITYVDALETDADALLIILKQL